MITCYIRLVQAYQDPVWGQEATPWLKSPLIRVTRNRLRKSVWEWVGVGEIPEDHLRAWQKSYPIVIQETSLHSVGEWRKPRLP